MLKTYEFKEVWMVESSAIDSELEESKTYVEQLNELGREGWMVAHLIRQGRFSRTYLLQREMPSGSPYRD